MTTIQVPTSRSSDARATSAGTPTDQVRRVMRADAVLCAVLGVGLVAGAGPVADLIGVDPSWSVAAAGAFLLGLAAALFAISRAAVRPLLALTPWSAEGDFVWAAASVVVAVTVSLTGPGRALIAGQGLVAVAMGVAKLQAVRAAR
jgi:hypothetical protein